MIHLESIPNSTGPPKIIHNLTKHHQLALRIVDGNSRVKVDNESGTLLVVFHGKPFLNFGTNPRVNFTAQPGYSKLMKLFDQSNENYKQLKDRLTTLNDDL